MSIGGVNSVNPLLAQLQTQGLSKDKSNLVAADVAAVTQDSTGAATPITPAVRSAIDAKIASDVLSGKLSASDAADAKKALDTVEAQDTATAASAPTATTTTAAPAKSGGAKGGGGGGGSSDKTEVSETVTVSGSTMTTVITYSDNTTSTTTTEATDADVARYSKPADTSGAAKEYGQSIQPGLLIDQLA